MIFLSTKFTQVIGIVSTGDDAQREILLKIIISAVYILVGIIIGNKVK